MIQFIVTYLAAAFLTQLLESHDWKTLTLAALLMIVLANSHYIPI
jgi:hypothetical protein